MSINKEIILIQARQMYEMGLLEREQAVYDQALECYQQAEKLYSKINDQKGVVECYNQMANVYKHLGNYPNSMSYFQRALVICEENSFPKKRALILANMGTLFNFQSEYEKAIAHWEEALRFHRQNEDIFYESVCLGDVATSYLKVGRLDDAERALKRSLHLHRE